MAVHLAASASAPTALQFQPWGRLLQTLIAA
jgi:hypothetical protein